MLVLLLLEWHKMPSMKFKSMWAKFKAVFCFFCGVLWMSLHILPRSTTWHDWESYFALHRDLSNLLVCGELPSFPNTTLVDTHGTQINKSCFTESPALTNEETLAIRSSLGLYLDQAHTIVQHMQGTSSSQQDEILLKIVVTLATGLASFAFFLALGWGIYRISAAPKLLNADLSNTAGSWWFLWLIQLTNISWKQQMYFWSLGPW